MVARAHKPTFSVLVPFPSLCSSTSFHCTSAYSRLLLLSFILFGHHNHEILFSTAISNQLLIATHFPATSWNNWMTDAAILANAEKYSIEMGSELLPHAFQRQQWKAQSAINFQFTWRKDCITFEGLVWTLPRDRNQYKMFWIYLSNAENVAASLLIKCSFARKFLWICEFTKATGMRTDICHNAFIVNSRNRKK